jgi:hypothetical protein
MRDAKVFIEDHSLKGQVIELEGASYTLGKIYLVKESRRLYVQLFKDSREVNIPLHKVAKVLFEETIF